MPKVTVKKELNSGIYFLTFTIVNWYYIFDRYERWDILLDSLKYCQKNMSLKVYSWVFMINHIHVLIESEDVISFVRDYKKFTAKKLLKNIELYEPSLLKLFKKNSKYVFWQEKNMPERIESELFYRQKLKYIENNPVRRKYVDSPDKWFYSSANPDQLLRLESIYC